MTARSGTRRTVRVIVNSSPSPVICRWLGRFLAMAEGLRCDRSGQEFLEKLSKFPVYQRCWAS
ncbi:hypothetical protein CKA32_002225 [Geitlerinema sp. FC II]|nr:hypothetical protein CKA32_002225 [Geitlerinema sp. FC II]